MEDSPFTTASVFFELVSMRVSYTQGWEQRLVFCTQYSDDLIGTFSISLPTLDTTNYDSHRLVKLCHE